MGLNVFKNKIIITIYICVAQSVHPMQQSVYPMKQKTSFTQLNASSDRFVGTEKVSSPLDHLLYNAIQEKFLKLHTDNQEQTQESYFNKLINKKNSSI